MQMVLGSSPSGPIELALVAQWIECIPPKVEIRVRFPTGVLV